MENAIKEYLDYVTRKRGMEDPMVIELHIMAEQGCDLGIMMMYHDYYEDREQL